MRAKVFVLGDSQVSPLIHALADERFRKSLQNHYTCKLTGNASIVQDFTLALANGETILNPILSMAFSPTLQAAKTFWVDNTVLFVFGGAEHHRYSHQAAHEFEHAPDAMVRAFFKNVFARFDEGLALIRKRAGARPFYILQSPPPSIHDGLASAPFRRRIYDVATGELTRIVAANGGVFIAPPEGIEDADGMLRAEFVTDPVHANAKYGKILLQHLDALVE